MTPLALRLDAEHLHVEWPDAVHTIPALRLRAHCRCSACQRLARDGQALRIAANLRLVDATPAGAYGVQLHFSDGHKRGIYPWSHLRELAVHGAEAGDGHAAHPPR